MREQGTEKLSKLLSITNLVSDVAETQRRVSGSGINSTQRAEVLTTRQEVKKDKLSSN